MRARRRLFFGSIGFCLGVYFARAGVDLLPAVAVGLGLSVASAILEILWKRSGRAA